jgi:hypothetical protein
MNIQYEASVFTAAGWRAVTITATATQVSAGMAQVEQVIEIDGAPPVGYTSRTGAKRQQYHAAGIALREVGKRKRISTCKIIEEAPA